MPQNDLSVALENDRSLKAQLLALYPALADDEAALIDTLDGISDLDEQIITAMRAALEREAYAEGLAGLIKQMGERKARLAEGADRIRAAVLHTMLEAGRGKITAADMTLAANSGRAGVQVLDEALLPLDCVVVTRRPDMKAINAAIKDGRAIPGTAPKNPRPFLTVRLA